MPEITENKLNKILGLDCTVRFSSTHTGLLDTKKPNTLSYVSSIKYIEEVNSNVNINAVLTNADLAPLIDKMTIVTEDPAWAFWSLHNHYALEAEKKSYTKTVIHPSAIIHPTAYIADNNVSIGEKTIVEPNVTIHSNVVIGDRCIIRSGSVCGFDGFEHKRTKSGVISVRHDGLVVIANDVEIGTLNSVARGFSWKHTTIGRDTKTDSLVHIAHGVSIGDRCFITACAEISGSVEIGNDCWLGPNCSVINGVSLGNKVFVGIGAVVTKSFPENSVVAGNPAKVLRMQ